MIQDMLLFLRGTPAQDEQVDINEVVDEAAQAVEPQMAARGIDFGVSVGGIDARVRGNAKAIVGVIVNLLENAMQACEQGALIRLGAAVSAGDVVIDVRDNGPGMEPGVLERLFEPFFTTRAQGTGLGLAIVQSVMQAHGGRVDVESSVGGGSHFSLHFPKETR